MSIIDCSLVVPCFNEEGNIEFFMEKCSEFLSNPKHEIILVNNGSNDKTEEKINIFLNRENVKKVNVKKNIGFGDGVIQGLKECRGELLCYSHSDNECDPSDIIRAIKTYSKEQNNNMILVKGERIDRLSNGWSYFDIFISTGMSVFESLLFRMKLYDIHAQPVLFHKTFQKFMKNPPNDFMLDLYMMVIAKKNKIPIKRFPVHFNKKGRLYGTPQLNEFKKKINISILRILSSVKYFNKW